MRSKTALTIQLVTWFLNVTDPNIKTLSLHTFGTILTPELVPTEAQLHFVIDFCVMSDQIHNAVCMNIF